MGDRLRLGDTGLPAEVKADHVTHGDEAVFGGGKTMQDGMGMQSGVTQAEGALDWVFTNVVVIDPVLGIWKGDLGVREDHIDTFALNDVLELIEPRTIWSR